MTPAKLSTAAKATLTGAPGPAGPKGASGATGSQGIQGLKGEKGERGLTGEAGTGVAYAKIEANGTVVSGLTKNAVQANVTNPATGTYSFNGLSFTPNAAVATPQFYGPKPTTLALYLGVYPVVR